MSRTSGHDSCWIGDSVSMIWWRELDELHPTQFVCGYDMVLPREQARIALCSEHKTYSTPEEAEQAARAALLVHLEKVPEEDRKIAAAMLQKLDPSRGQMELFT